MTRRRQAAELVRALGGAAGRRRRARPRGRRAAVAEAEPEVDRPPAHGARRRVDLRHFDRDFAADQPAAHRGHRPPAGRRPRGRRAARSSRRATPAGPTPATAAPVKTEDDPLDPDPPEPMRATLDAIRHLEEAVTGAELGRGHRAPLRRLLRPRHDLGIEPGGRARSRLIRKRQFPVVGDGARRVVLHPHRGRRRRPRWPRSSAARRGDLQHRRRRARAGRGVAAGARRGAVGAKPPRHVPRWLGRLLAGEAATVMMTEVRGASNAKAKRELGWEPRAPELARRLRRGARREPSARGAATRSCGRGRSRSPTGCSAASAEAEDVVQEAFLRLHRALEDGERIESPRGLSGDGRHPAGDRRAALGAGAPRDLRRRVAAGAAASPTATTTRPRTPRWPTRSSLAFLVLLESLSPEQRAVFLLRDVFDYGYDEIAAIVGKSEASARQLAARARRHVERAAAALRDLARSSATSWPSGSSPPPSEGDLGGARGAAGRRTSCCTATAAARCRRWRGRSTAARGWPGRCWPGRAPGARLGGRRAAPRRGQRPAGRDRCSTATASVLSVLALDIAGGRGAAPSARSSTPTSSRHLGPVGDYGALLEAARRAD